MRPVPRSVRAGWRLTVPNALSPSLWVAAHNQMFVGAREPTPIGARRKVQSVYFETDFQKRSASD
jgi:hypothetical protein